MKRLQLMLAVSLFLFLPAARGQIGLYASFSGSQWNVPNTNWFYGSTLGAYYDGIHLPVVNFGLDARASILGGSGGTRVDGGMIGPRALVHLPLLPLKVYGEGLAGAAHAAVGQGFAYTNGTYFEYGLVAGGDLTILPRLDWRIVDYSYSRLPNMNGGVNQMTLSTGLVLRLPVL